MCCGLRERGGMEGERGRLLIMWERLSRCPAISARRGRAREGGGEADDEVRVYRDHRQRVRQKKMIMTRSVQGREEKLRAEVASRGGDGNAVEMQRCGLVTSRCRCLISRH